MRSINRVAIVVRPKQPFIDWAVSLDSELIQSPDRWCSVYLVEASEEADLPGILKQHFDDVFHEQLHSWYTASADWPPSRTFAMFQDWFEAEVVDLVLDLSPDEPIEFDD